MSENLKTRAHALFNKASDDLRSGARHFAYEAVDTSKFVLKLSPVVIVPFIGLALLAGSKVTGPVDPSIKTVSEAFRKAGISDQDAQIIEPALRLHKCSALNEYLANRCINLQSQYAALTKDHQ